MRALACVVNGDGTTITCQIFVNIGLDNYLTMRVSPIDIITTGGSYTSYAFQSKGLGRIANRHGDLFDGQQHHHASAA
jgi:hypothetical protein